AFAAAQFIECRLCLGYLRFRRRDLVGVGLGEDVIEISLRLGELRLGSRDACHLGLACGIELHLGLLQGVFGLLHGGLRLNQSVVILLALRVVYLVLGLVALRIHDRRIAGVLASLLHIIPIRLRRRIRRLRFGELFDRLL